MNFFRQLLMRHFWTKIISFMIAIVLWIIVLGSRSVEIAKEVPLRVLTADNVIPSSELPKTITFRLSGPKAFLRTILDRRDAPVIVDLSGAKPGVVTYRFFPDSIQVPTGVKVESIRPSSIIVKLEEAREKTVPLKVTTQGVPPEGYEIYKVSATPDSVRIRGAKSKVDAIPMINTIPIDVGGIKNTLVEDAKIALETYGVELVSQLPKVSIEMRASSANFRIKNIPIKVLTDYSYRLSKDSATVFVRANPEDLEYLDQSQVFAEIDLRGQPKGTYTRLVQARVPNHIGLVKVEPKRVKVTLY